MTSCKTHKILNRHFDSLGRRIAKFPKWFIFAPVFTSLLLTTGLHRLKSIQDWEYFATIDNSDINHIRDFIDSQFPMNVTSEFALGRYTKLGSSALAIIKAKDGGSLLRDNVAKEIIQLINAIQNITIESDSKIFRYEDLCAKNKGKCYFNDVVPLYQNYNGTFSFKYPIEYVGEYGFQFYGTWMSGVNVNEAGMATYVKNSQLIYVLDETRSSKELQIDQWLFRFEEDVRSMEFKSISVLAYTAKSISREFGDVLSRSIPYMSVAFVLVIGFTIATCIAPNCVQGKPWTGVTTAMGSILASVSGFGLLTYFGVPFLYYNILIPFIVLGVGMHDTFVFLAAWTRTDRKKSVEERLGETYSESSVAVSFTSMTNVVSFAIGAAITQYPPARVFCALTSCCLLFDFIYQITFVGACLAVLGFAEKKNLHCFTMIPVKPLNSPEGPKGCVQKILFWTGHYTIELKETSFLFTIWDKLGSYLTKTSIKVIVVLIFGIYFSFGCWRASNLTNEILIEELAFYDSPTYKFLRELRENFQQYFERLQVIFPTIIDYSDTKTRRLLQKITNELESTEFLCDSSMTESWLRSFYQFLEDPRYSAITSSYNKTDKRDFITLLRGYFLRHPVAKRFRRDIVFNDNYTEIVASRFLFQTNYTKDLNTFNTKWQKLQELTSGFSIPVLVFSRLALITEGVNLAIPLTLQCIGVAVCAVSGISYLFLCSVKCTVCVTFCIVSIVIGILGYMNVWGETLNMVSMTILMLVSGFSVDCASHIASAYVSADGTSSEKLRKSVSNVGLPIFQACATTLLSVSAFVVPPAYCYLTLMKVIFLLSALAGLHALIFLPVFLCLAEDLSKYIGRAFKEGNKFDISAVEKYVYANHSVNQSGTEEDKTQRRNVKPESDH